MNIGVITYDIPHLKTEQLLLSLLQNNSISKITLYALPFVSRKARLVKYPHRPDQKLSINQKEFISYSKVYYQGWDGKSHVSHNDEVVIIAGGGIINPNLFGNTPILNVHPGLIPLVRGLDSFKWSIYLDHPLGVSLHVIDEKVDKGVLLCVKKTPVFASDTYYSLARRHYELEINLLTDSLRYVGKPIVSEYGEQPANMRMPVEKEISMIGKFENWKLKYCLK